MTPEAVLRNFAELASERSETVPTSVLSGGSTFLWQRYRALSIFDGKSIGPAGMPFETGLNRGSTSLEIYEDRVLATAKLHQGERRMSIGWIWFSGTLAGTTYCFPAVSIPVDWGEETRGVRLVEAAAMGSAGWTPGRTRQASTSRSLGPAGDVELTKLVKRTDDRDRLVETCNFGDGRLVDTYVYNTNEYTPVSLKVFPELTELNSWIDAVAKTVGLPVSQIKAAHQGTPIDSLNNDSITVHIGCALYVEPAESLGVRSDSLVALGRMTNVESTALGTLYDRTPVESKQVESVIPIRPLSSRQTSIAAELVGADLSVLSGAPGTGKSHVLSVAAMNAIARGNSVLVVAGSPHAVDVLAEHFAQSPGPPPVVFGGSRYGKQLARDVSELASRGGSHAPADLDTADLAEQQRLLDSIVRLLDVEREVVRMQRAPALRLELVHARERAGDLAELESLIERCEADGRRGWLARKRHLNAVAERLGQPNGHRAALERLRRGAEAQRLDADGGLSLAEVYDGLVAIEKSAARQRGRELTEQWLDGIDADQRSALSTVSTALSSSRTLRRQLFADIEPADLTSAAPLWIGSIRDVEEILPTVPGLFDLLLVDEAAQIDQLNAVHALVRAKRVVICGDPRQLGHVPYMSQDDLYAMSKQRPVEGDVLDVGNMSLFDVGATRVPAMVLDEHFRSAPHIIEFSARRMYEGELHVVGRNPANEAADHIHVTHVEGQRNDELVNVVEVEACIAIGEQLIADGFTSIGFISPFDQQAAALEEAILDRWQLEEIDAYGLRVGTVHGFQGDERDVTVLSWAIGPNEGVNVWSHVNQPNLFNVMVTRARDQVYVVTSTEKPPGLAGDYLRWSEPLTNLVRDVEIDDPWVNKVAEVLREAGYPVRMGYAVGRHHVDLVVGDADAPIAIDCVPHTDGPAAHTDRALQLRRMGWRTGDLFESKWGERLGEIEIELEQM